jgi:pimeloyl-ACP methyl ester carboxylesterase
MSFLLVLGLLAGLLLISLALAVGYFVVLTRRIAARAEKLVPPSGKFVAVGGNRIHYVEQGEGRPILFIHGLGAQLHHFRHPLFGTFGPGYRLISLDRPGSGYSVRAAGSTARLTEQADVIAGFIEKLGLERPLLVGHSLGGAVALATALNHPRSISGIVLLAPVTHIEETIRPEFKGLYIRSPLKRWLLAHTVAVPRSLKLAPKTLAFVFGPQKWPDNYAVAGGGMAGLRPSHIYATASDVVAIERDLESLQNRYGEIKMPAGILFGVADRVLDYRHHGLPMRDKIAGIEVEIVDGLGHMPQYGETRRVIAFIRRVAAKAFAGRGMVAEDPPAARASGRRR